MDTHSPTVFRGALTRSGAAMAIGTVVLLGVGWLLDYPELVLIGLAGAGCLVLAALWMLVRPDVEVTRVIDPMRVVAGGEAWGTVTVTNRGRRRSPPILASEAVGPERVAVSIPSLPRGGAHFAVYPLPTLRRGVFPAGPLYIGHTDPLRLMAVGGRFGSRSTLVVHPTVHDVVPLPTGRSRDMDGPTSHGGPQGGVAFHSLREYRRGDDLRMVHWLSTARTGQLMVRHNVIPNEPRMLVVLDTSAEPYSGEAFEEAVRVAASLCMAGHARGYPIEVRTTSGVGVTSQRGSGAPEALLDMLAAVTPAADDPGLAALLRTFPREDGTALGVVTGQAPTDALAAVSLVESRYEMTTLVQVGEPWGRPPPALRGVLSLNVETSRDFAAAWNALVAS